MVVIFVKEIGENFNGFVYTFVLCAFIIIAIFLMIIKRVDIIIKSLRIDQLIAFILGMNVCISFNRIVMEYYYLFIINLNKHQLISLGAIPVCLIISTIIYRIIKSKKDVKESRFLDDNEIKNISQDKFNLNILAEDFANSIYNNKSELSFVFGIDAPWGAGKSSFINLVKDNIEKNYRDEVIFYDFNPTRYENTSNLLTKFIEGLKSEIKNNIYIPEIDSILSYYLKIVKQTKPSVNIFGLKFNLPYSRETIDSTLSRLDIVLKNLNKKIIVVIDDLDRINYSSIKKILFSIQKAFSLSNINFVLCYDVENIVQNENRVNEANRISEFLEKYVNIKYCLHIDHKTMINYFINIKDDLIKNPANMSSILKDLSDLFESQNYYHYSKTLGDPRKLKRLINLIILLKIEELNLDDYDINSKDLIHLLIIYLNYPHTYRKLIITETKGKKGYFSLVNENDINYPEDKEPNNNNNFKSKPLKNSTLYEKYLEEINDEDQRFILNQIFAQKANKNPNLISEESYSSLACFNNSFSNKPGNLEQYINIISNMEFPKTRDQYRYYANIKNRIFEGESINKVYEEKLTTYDRGDSHNELWRIISNTPRNDFNFKKAQEIILFGLELFKDFSFIEIGGQLIQLRLSISVYIVLLLNKVGWYEEDYYLGSNNDEDNVVTVANWIFGDDEFENIGIIDLLLNKNKGILGIFDVLFFRQNCIIDSTNDIFDLSRALIVHGKNKINKQNSTLSLNVIEEMREISQVIFDKFNKLYIKTKINLFEEVNKLKKEDFYAKQFEYVQGLEEKGGIENLEQKVEEAKSTLKVYVIYQLTNAEKSSKISCGYYNINDKLRCFIWCYCNGKNSFVYW
jgi:hypothetical protein